MTRADRKNCREIDQRSTRLGVTNGWHLGAIISLAAISALLVFGTRAEAAGTVPGFSLTPQFDLTGKVMPGCKLYVIQAGTVLTPQNAYQDTGLSISQRNPLSCDASGRLPQWFVADGTIKLRLTTAAGVQIFVGDNLLVVGPSSGGGGGGGTVDPTTVLQTGMAVSMYGTGILNGFVRCNGRTIGSVTSGATERANSDVQALFQYFWGVDPNLAVSGGRGVSANADWVANKTLTLPDCRGRGIAGLDDMGNSAASRLTSSFFGATATTLGAVGGAEKVTLAANQIPAGVPSSGNNSISVASSFTDVIHGALTSSNAPGGSNLQLQNGSAAVQLTSSGNNNISVTSSNASQQDVRTVQPTILMTVYFKM